MQDTRNARHSRVYKNKQVELNQIQIGSIGKNRDSFELNLIMRSKFMSENFVWEKCRCGEVAIIFLKIQVLKGLPFYLTLFAGIQN